MALSWAEFEASAPALATPGAALLLRFGPGLGYLATVRKDGGPRLHPVCPLLAAGGLYVFVIGRSPKRFDLERDGRFALHSFPAPDDDDQFYCAGTAAGVTDAALRARLATTRCCSNCVWSARCTRHGRTRGDPMPGRFTASGRRRRRRSEGSRLGRLRTSSAGRSAWRTATTHGERPGRWASARSARSAPAGGIERLAVAGL